jgi:hypothetical protein
MVIGLPGENTRWRCRHCGNLTRFDVQRRRLTSEFWHLDLAGVPRIDDVVVQQEEILAVRCRWCGADDGVVEVARPDSEQEAGFGGTP